MHVTAHEGFQASKRMQRQHKSIIEVVHTMHWVSNRSNLSSDSLEKSCFESDFFLNKLLIWIQKTKWFILSCVKGFASEIHCCFNVHLLQKGWNLKYTPASMYIFYWRVGFWNPLPLQCTSFTEGLNSQIYWRFNVYWGVGFRTQSGLDSNSICSSQRCEMLLNHHMHHFYGGFAFCLKLKKNLLCSTEESRRSLEWKNFYIWVN